MEYNDFSKPWWSEDAVDQMTINGKDFMISGDLAVTLWDGMTCFYFNKKVAEDRKVGDLYSIVRDGEWTFDKLIGITKDSYQDLDGDGEMSEGDAFGLILGSATTTDNFKEAFEIPVVKRGADGFPEYALKSEKLVDVLTRLNSYVHDAHDVYYVADLSRYNLEAVFKQGNSMFLTSQLGVTKRLRDMKDDFGIIPYPKYDEAQESYHSTSLDEFSMFVIPIDAPDKEMTSIITEALAAESYKKVIPTFYDIVLKAKTARDDESAEMIDIIRDGFTLDWGYVYSVTLGMPGHLLSVLVKTDNDNLVSMFDYYAPLYEENLNKVLKPYR